MVNWDIRDETGHCSAEDDFRDASFVCDKLKIPLERVDFVKEYWNEVFTYVCSFLINNFLSDAFLCLEKSIDISLSSLISLLFITFTSNTMYLVYFLIIACL